jgi:hypothetical protein
MNRRNFLTIPFVIIGILLLSFVGYFVITKNSYVGVLSTTANCMIPEGCGSKYKLFDSSLQTYTPLLGNIKEADSGLILRITGSRIILLKSEAILASSYSVLSKIPYHDFLVNKAGEYTMQKYPCLTHTVYGKVGTNYDKTFSWQLNGNMPILKVKMSGSSGSYELWYDGNSGNFIKEVVDPIGTVFCR